jgi:hypothetical protein
MFIIDDRNYRDVMKRSEDQGFATGLLPEPAEFAAGKLPHAPPFSESFAVIPRAEWKDRIKAREDRPLSRIIRQAGIPTFSQGRTNWCWAHAATKMACACLATQGTGLVLAPESVAGPASGWRNAGGTLTQGLDQLRKGGACTRDFVLRANSVSPSAMREGWQENALLHRVDEYYSLIGSGVWDQMVTAGLLGFAIACGVAWWSHALCYLDPVLLPDGTIGIQHDNSHSSDYGEDGFAVFSESRGTPEVGWGVIACRSVLYYGPQPPQPQG